MNLALQFGIRNRFKSKIGPNRRFRDWSQIINISLRRISLKKILFLKKKKSVLVLMENVVCVLNTEDPNIPGLEDEDDAPTELLPENVVNPQPQLIVQATVEEVHGVPIPDPLLQDADGEFLIPFVSMPFAPRGIGKLNAVRRPVPMTIDPPVLEAAAAPPVLEAAAAPPVLEDALNVEPAPLPLPTGVPSNAAALNVVEPLLLPSAVDAGSSNAAGSKDVAVVVPPGTPDFARHLYEFLMLGIDDPNLSSVMKWTDDHTFQVLNRSALETLYPQYFGSDNSTRFNIACGRYGIVQVGKDEWRHRHGYLCRGRPISLQAMQDEFGIPEEPAMNEEGQEHNLEMPPRSGGGDSSSC
ncbi:hypothetical protein M0R45_033179 [Rubus argutus]|uniref:HSF-type DNA-binding domain-containing protein n=1 Tax=Rubus argutus TaxID=59490 RepID=A0AAW1WLS1_RUBAR